MRWRWVCFRYKVHQKALFDIYWRIISQIHAFGLIEQSTCVDA